MEKQKTYTFEIPGLAELLARVERNEKYIEQLLKERTQGQLSYANKNWYTLQDAADRLNCSKKTVTRLIKRGDLSKHLGQRHVRISKDSIEEYEKKFTTGRRFKTAQPSY